MCVCVRVVWVFRLLNLLYLCTLSVTYVVILSIDRSVLCVYVYTHISMLHIHIYYIHILQTDFLVTMRSTKMRETRKHMWVKNSISIYKIFRFASPCNIVDNFISEYKCDKRGWFLHRYNNSSPALKCYQNSYGYKDINYSKVIFHYFFFFEVYKVRMRSKILYFYFALCLV